MAGMERFTQRARRVLSLAHAEAERAHHPLIGTEHLLIGLIEEEGGVAGRVLREMGLEPDRIREIVYRLTGEGKNPPGEKIGQCETCHAPDTYYPVDPTRVQATTTNTGASISSQTDDFGITPNTAICSGCHTTSTAALHMTQNGGLFDVVGGKTFVAEEKFRGPVVKYDNLWVAGRKDGGK